MRRLRAPLVLFVEVVIFYAPVLFTKHAIPYDLEGYHQPLAGFIAASLRQGEFPLWDPYTYCGVPLYANIQTQLFYPPAWPVFLLSAINSHNLYRLLECEIVLHVFLAGCFTYLLLRRLRIGRGAALYGATVFQLGGFFASQTQHLGAMCGSAWLPLAWYGLLVLRERVSWRRIGLLAFAIAMPFLAGFPSTAAVVAATTLLLSLLLRRTRLIASAGLACALGILLSGIALLPAFELSGQSIASHRGEWTQGGGGVPLQALVSMVRPNHYDIFDLRKYRTYKLQWNPSFMYLYSGLAALLLAPLALVLSRHKDRVPLLLVTIFAGFWMVCEYTPVGRTFFRLLPRFLRGAVYSEFAMAAFLLGFATLAALGAETLLARRGAVVMGALVVLTAFDLTRTGANSWMNTGDGVGLSYVQVDHSRTALNQMRALVEETFPPGRMDSGGKRAWVLPAPLVRLPNANGDDPLALWRLLQVRLCFAQGDYWNRYYEVAKPESRILDLLNVRFVVTGPDGTMPEPKFFHRQDLREGSPVWENREVLPRFFLVHRVQLAAGLPEAIAMLQAPAFDPAQVAVVENYTGPVPAAAGGTVRTVRYTASTLELAVDAPSDSFLVTSEAFYPGWRAWVDGRERPLVLTNAAFRGLAVPPGQHRIEMRFQPRILRYGALISLLALVVVAAGCFWESRSGV